MTPPWPEHCPEAVLLSLKVPSLHSAVEPLGGFASALVLDAGLLAAVFVVVVLVLDVLVAVVVVLVVFVAFDTEVVFDVVLEFDIELFEGLFAAELLVFVAAPPQANVKAIRDNNVIRSKSLVFIC